MNSGGVSGPDTIFALSTAPGRSGVAVVRISGPASRTALVALGGPGEPEARRAVLADLRSPEDDEATICEVTVATATAGGMPVKISKGVSRKPPPTPNRPEMKPTAAPIPSS